MGNKLHISIGTEWCETYDIGDLIAPHTCEETNCPKCQLSGMLVGEWVLNLKKDDKEQ